MSLDAIRKSILDEAETKASAIASEADSEARRIVRDAESRAKEIIRNAGQEAENEAERLRKESAAGADAEANAILLEARGAAVEKALKIVESQLGSELSRHGMKKVLDNSIRQFRQICGGELFRIRTSKKNAALLKGLKFDVEYGDVDGFVISSADGSMALNATVDSIVGREADSARSLIAHGLFGSKASTSARGSRRAGAAKIAKPKGRKRG